MKILLDANISYRVVNKIKDVFPKASHLKFHTLEECDDIKIWEFAKENNYTIITNDSDFNDFLMVWGMPPKIIWLRMGNLSTKNIIKLLISKKQNILDFINNEKTGILIFE